MFVNSNHGCKCCRDNGGSYKGAKVKLASGKLKFETGVKCRSYTFSADYLYIDSKNKVSLICPRGTKYTVAPRHFNSGKGCGCCSDRRYDVKSPCNFYIQSLSNEYGIVSYKFGVTTKPVAIRMNQQSKQSVYVHKILKCFVMNSGRDAIALESMVKNTLSTHYLEKRNMRDGYTETINPKDYDVLLSIVVGQTTN